MPWNGDEDGNKGPWGGGGGPWGGPPPDDKKRGSNGRERPKPGDGGRKPPDLDALLKTLLARLRGVSPGGGTGSPFGPNTHFWPLLLAAALIVAALWLATGIYRVQPDEQGVVLRFGAYYTTTQPGLHYHFPQPIETVLKPTVTRVRRSDIGFGIDSDGTAVQVPSESLMLTGDENIVDINLSVFWTVKDARAYLFNIRNADATVKSAAESAIREIVGQNPISPVLAEGRGRIENATQTLLQSILDAYGSGILITEIQLQKADPPQPVIEAFRDVQRARTDMDRLRNEAEAYRNDVLPRARGDAQRLTQEAEGYQREIVARAQGDAQRFDQVYRAWSVAKEVTTQRLYLETMEDVLKGAHKVIIERGLGGPGVLPLLSLNDGATAQRRRIFPNAGPLGPDLPDTNSSGADSGGLNSPGSASSSLGIGREEATSTTEGSLGDDPRRGPGFSPRNGGGGHVDVEPVREGAP